MELFIFALISAQGVQLLVDRKVNYKKVTNQIITSVTLLTGLSGVSVNLNVTPISGLSLAFLVGVILNLIFRILSYFGIINEKMNVIDIINVCYSVLNRQYEVTLESNEISHNDFVQYLKGENRTEQVLNLANNLSIYINENMSIYKLKKLCKKL